MSHGQLMPVANLCRVAVGSFAKVVGSCEKGHKNAESGTKSPTGRYSYRQDV